MWLLQRNHEGGSTNGASIGQTQRTAEPAFLLSWHVLLVRHIVILQTQAHPSDQAAEIFPRRWLEMWVMVTVLDEACHPSIHCTLKYKLQDIRKPSCWAIYLFVDYPGQEKEPRRVIPSRGGQRHAIPSSTLKMCPICWQMFKRLFSDA